MVSLAGSWMQMTAQAWLVLVLTGSAFKLGLVTTLQFAPVLLFTLFAGVLADRLPKRTILLVTQSAQAVFAVVLAWLTLSGRVEYWHVACLAALVGTARAFDTPARQAFLVEMTGREDLMNAIALNSSVFNLARVVGPALAGSVIKLVGTGWAFLANGLSFVAVIWALAAMRVVHQPRPDAGGAMRGIGDGLSYVRRTPLVRGIIVLLGFTSVFALNFSVLVPLMAKEVFHLDSSGYGFMMTALGVGALVGSICLATFGQSADRMSFVLVGALGLGVGEVALVFVGHPVAAALVLVVCGWAMVTYLASSNTAIQSAVPDELRGRVMSVYFLVFGGVTPLGALVAGTLAEHFGVSAAFGVVGGLTIAATLTMVVFRETPLTAGEPGSPIARQGKGRESAN